MFNMYSISLPQYLTVLRSCPIDTHEIEMKIRDFYLSLNFDEEDVKGQCMDARNHLDSARMLVRNLIFFEENDYIKSYKKAYFWMLDNLGRIDLKINEMETETIEALEKVEMYMDRELPNSPKVRKYINYLLLLMEQLVIYPLKKSIIRFKTEEYDSEGNKIIKEGDINLFCYYIFRELANISESLGAISSERVTTKQKTDISRTQSFFENKPTDSENPPENPEDAQTEINQDEQEELPELIFEE